VDTSLFSPFWRIRSIRRLFPVYAKGGMDLGRSKRTRCPWTPERLLPLHLFPQNLKQLVGGLFRQDCVELAAIILDKAHILYDNIIYFPCPVLQDLSLIHISEPTRRTPISYA